MQAIYSRLFDLAVSHRAQVAQVLFQPTGTPTAALWAEWRRHSRLVSYIARRAHLAAARSND